MNSKLSSVFRAAEVTRMNMLDLVKNIPDEQFFRNPRPDKWSISQILTHIILAEKLSLQYMKKKSLGIKDLRSTSVADDLRFLVLKLSQRVPLRYKAPPVLGESAPPIKSFSDISSEWSDERVRLEDFLYVLTDEETRKPIYKHPVAGRFNVIHAVSFFNEHCKHHLPQIKYILKSK